MYLNNVQFNADLYDILVELRSQLNANNIYLLDKLKDVGEDIMVTCPYHANGQERKPSAGVRKTDGKFHCFACGETHDLHELITYCFGHNDVLGKFGWNWLLKNFASVSIKERKHVYLDIKRRNGHSIINNSTDNIPSISYVVEEELDKYRWYHPYWKKRGITNEYIIELFDLGYDEKTNCITFPNRDIKGNCLFIARRSVRTKYFNYPKDVEKPLYGLYELYQIEQFPKEIIVCESMLDALSFWEIGKYAVALNGTGTVLQYKQLRELPCRKLILATDMDSAGIKARKKLRENITNKLITEYIFPKGIKDANQCLCELGPDTLRNLENIF